jgi:hypothetical protein
LKDIEAELAGCVDVRVKHLANELNRRRLVGILFFKVHHEPEGSVLEGRIRGTDDDGIPDELPVSRRVRVPGGPISGSKLSPSHDIIGHGGGRNTGRRIGLHTLYGEHVSIADASGAAVVWAGVSYLEVAH